MLPSSSTSSSSTPGSIRPSSTASRSPAAPARDRQREVLELGERLLVERAQARERGPRAARARGRGPASPPPPAAGPLAAAASRAARARARPPCRVPHERERRYTRCAAETVRQPAKSRVAADDRAPRPSRCRRARQRAPRGERRVRRLAARRLALRAGRRVGRRGRGRFLAASTWAAARAVAGLHPRAPRRRSRLSPFERRCRSRFCARPRRRRRRPRGRAARAGAAVAVVRRIPFESTRRRVVRVAAARRRAGRRSGMCPASSTSRAASGFSAMIAAMASSRAARVAIISCSEARVAAPASAASGRSSTASGRAARGLAFHRDEFDLRGARQQPCDHQMWPRSKRKGAQRHHRRHFTIALLFWPGVNAMLAETARRYALA